MPIEIKVEFDKPRAKMDIQNAGNEALSLLRDNIIEDINQYVPVQGGEPQDGGGGSLRQSAFIHSADAGKDGSLTLRWDTPYAQYQHGGLVMKGTPKDRSYGPEKLKYTSDMARANWTKYAAEQYTTDWAYALEKRMNGGGIVVNAGTRGIDA